MSADDLVDIINEEDRIIDRVDRREAHKKGLLHREVHVWLFTSDDELVFQHRSPNKLNYPDLLDASVGGHVDAGMGWIAQLLKNLKKSRVCKPRRKI